MRTQVARSAELRSIVARPEARTRWSVSGRGTLAGRAYVEAELVSQTWRGRDWTHALFLFAPPPDAPATSQGFLLLSGGDTPGRDAAWRARGELPGQSALFAALAREIRGPVACLLGVPNEPLDGLRGDALLAQTLAEFLASGDPETPLLVPMVKSAVRALDVLQVLAREELGLALETFTLAGASKRAWAAWLAAAIDARVTALVSLALEALNMPAQVRHQRASWGAISPALHDYAERGVLDGLLDAPDFCALLDPHAYRAALALPKLAVLAANDELYPCDSLALYWEDLPGPKHVLVLPNQAHDLGEHASLPGSVAAFHEAAQGAGELPRLAVTRRATATGLELALDGGAPCTMRLWRAASESRDFRRSPWTASLLEGAGPQRAARLTPPARGFEAHFVEALYPRARSPLHLCTSLAIADARGRIVSPGREGGAPGT